MKAGKTQRRRLRAMLDRWLRDEQWIGETMTDNAEYSNKTEMLRNLGSAIAYAQRELAAGRHALAGAKKMEEK